jgi:hypothetical protein
MKVGEIWTHKNVQKENPKLLELTVCITKIEEGMIIYDIERKYKNGKVEFDQSFRAIESFKRTYRPIINNTNFKVIGSD